MIAGISTYRSPTWVRLGGTPCRWRPCREPRPSTPAWTPAATRPASSTRTTFSAPAGDRWAVGGAPGPAGREDARRTARAREGGAEVCRVGASPGGLVTGCGQDSPGYGSVPVGGGREQVRNGGGNRRPDPSVACPGVVWRTVFGPRFPRRTAAGEGVRQGCGRGGAGGVCPVVVRVVPGCACNRDVLGGGWVERAAGPGRSW